MDKKLTKNKIILITVLVDLLLITAILYLMNYVQYLLGEDVRINLTEIVTQNKDVITSKLAVELNSLELEAKQIADYFAAAEEPDLESRNEIFLQYTEKGDKKLVWANVDGSAVMGTGEHVDVSGRAYFQYGMQGNTYISERLISRVTGEDIFVLCVPLYLHNEIIGTIQKQYTPPEIYELCSVSLFSEQGSTYIINSEGYILISSEKSLYSKESDNFFRILYSENPAISKKLEADIHNKQSGFFEAVMDGKRVFSAYTPIDEIHDWHLISSIATSAVSPNANIVVKMFYIILFVSTLFFTFSIVNYAAMKRKQQAILEGLAFKDPVTGGDSFTKFEMDVKNILSDGKQSFWICALDIDNFKYINGYYGFDTGDKILKHIYAHYSSLMGEKERFSRMTSDHFVMFLADASEERLKNLINMEVVIEDIRIYISAGLYKIENVEDRVSLMVDKASTAAQKGKGLHFKQIGLYSEDFDQKTAQVEQTKRAVEQALNNQEIIPFFQPKVDIHTRELIGAEALARWRTKEGKLVSPGEFIPICEKTGLITLVDMTIFEQTLRFLRENLDKGIRCVPISVNFSRVHLLNGEFIELVLAKLHQYEVPAELIELELTETVIFDNFQTINDFITVLHKHGLKISMDDFGSGYSSLYMLKDVDIDVMKIDRGFLLDTTSSSRQKAIFEAIVQMARKLKIKVVVEGVETIENVKLMEEFHCLYAQGYYFSRPMDMEQFRVVFEAGRV